MGIFGQDERLLKFTTPLGEDVLLPERVQGSEGISELFSYTLDLLATPDTTIEPKKIAGQKVTLSIQADDKGNKRYINGYVASFEVRGGDKEFNSYRAVIVPNIWVLTLNKNTRVFQDKTVTDVVKEVLSPYNISPSIETSNTYTPMEYCTQYRETDFDFISRLMEQHGILYYFKHTENDHTFTLQDTSSKLADCAIQSSFRYAPEGHDTEGFYDFVVSEFGAKSTMVTGKHTLWDYSFIRYQAVPSGQGSSETKGPLGANKNENYDYAESAAAYLKKADSDGTIASVETLLQTVQRDICDAEEVVIAGESNAVSMTAGYSFSLTEHPQLNNKYLLTRVEMGMDQLPSYRTRPGSAEELFSNRFAAIPFSTPYRPPLKTRKPVVNGMHTGMVVVPSGEDSYMDKYGRVCVQFFWDRLRKKNTTDNTLLRVAQGWAGKGWGTYFWPRVDDEVLIDFMEGDPDQPIVVGSVYNGVNMPKYDPAGQYTLSGILTRSSKEGAAANANELRFEDLKGKEQVYMNAERDYDLHVENSHHTLIGKEQHEQIGTDHYMQTKGDTHRHVEKKLYEQIDDEVHQKFGAKQIIQVVTDKDESIGSGSVLKVSANADTKVGGNLTEKVGGNYSLDVGMKEDHKVGMAYNIDAGMTINIKAGMQVVIDAPMGVNLTSGGNFVNVTPAGVMIQGLLVNINSGGAAMSAQSASTQDPKAPASPTAPTDPTFPGDAPPSQAATAAAGQAAVASTITEPSAASSSKVKAAASAPSPAPSASNAVASAENQAQQAAQQATQEASNAANQAAKEAQQAAQAAQQAAKAAEQQAQQAVDQVTQEARQAYQQANQAVQQAQQAVNQAAAQGQQAAQQAMNEAQQAANQTAQQAAQSVQQAQQQAQQVQQQAQQAAQQAQQAAQQAEQQAQQAAQQAQQQAQQVAQQGQQAAQQAQQQAQQAAQQAQQQAQQAAAQAQQAAQQAQQQAQQAAQQVNHAAQGAQQQAQQSAQQAQQSAQKAMGQAMKGF